MKIEVHNNKQYKQALILFSSFTGLPIHGYVGVDKDFAADEYIKEFPMCKNVKKYVGISDDNSQIATWTNSVKSLDNKNFSDPRDLVELMKYLSSYQSNIVVENVGEYKAIIKHDSITVGCTTISFKKFDEIVKAVAKMRNKN